MDSNITKKQIDLCRYILSKYDPYPIEVLKNLSFDDDKYDENRVSATMAKKILLDNNIPLTDEEPKE